MREIQPADAAAAFPPPPADRDALERGDTLTPRFGPDGLIPAVATDARTGEVLMLAWMNAQALALTLETGDAHYWSRSRARLWRKGETSGQVQRVIELRVDCDQDAVWIKVAPQGDGGACHVGFRSCFYRVAQDGELRLALSDDGASDGDGGDDDLGDPGVTLEIALDTTGGRLDRTLAAHPTCVAAPVSRERLKRLILDGAVRLDGLRLRDPSAAARAGRYHIVVPALVEAQARPQPMPLTVLFEDAHLIVVDKPAGLAVHPGAGIPDGTLVNALLHHCGPSLGGVGGVARPGIVHRLDKGTSGVMVAAKTDAAHQGLSRLFAAHDIDRLYLALTRGAPSPPRGSVATRIGRSPHDRQKMAVLKTGGREAVTHYALEANFGPAGKPLAARVACRLETGRTHQIRVHLASLGAPVLGDPVYGSGPVGAALAAAIADAGLTRQALHAAVLGFVHPITRGPLRFETPPPADMAALETELRTRNISQDAGVAS